MLPAHASAIFNYLENEFKDCQCQIEGFWLNDDYCRITMLHENTYSVSMLLTENRLLLTLARVNRVIKNEHNLTDPQSLDKVFDSIRQHFDGQIALERYQ